MKIGVSRYGLPAINMTASPVAPRPLIVVTAAKEAQAGWLPLQDEMAALSTNSIHRVLPNTTHASLIEDRDDAAMASQAIRDVIEASSHHDPLTKPQGKPVALEIEDRLAFPEGAE